MRIEKINNFRNFKDEEVEVRGTMSVVMADAINNSERKKEILDDKFKEQLKNAEEFVKEQEKNKKVEVKVNNTAYKKMRLSESLFTEKVEKESEDLWTRVYNNLATDLDVNEVNHEVPDTFKGCRYNNMSTDVDGNIVVFGHDVEDFDFAKEVADHYKVETRDIKDEGSNKYYRYSMKIIIPQEEVYDPDKQSNK